MKSCVLIILGVVALATTTLQARIGEQYQQTDTRYGKPIQIVGNFNQPRQNELVRIYSYKGCEIRCHYATDTKGKIARGTCLMERVSFPGNFELATINELLAANKGSSTWEAEKGYIQAWNTKDGTRHAELRSAYVINRMGQSLTFSFVEKRIEQKQPQPKGF